MHGEMAMGTTSSLGLAALVALVVSAIVSGLVKFVFDDALAGRKAARDYAYERRKQLHALVGTYDGRLLESAADFYVRVGNITDAADPKWLVPKPGETPGYFLASTVYRFVALMRLAVAFDREAIYFDPEIASRHDLRCIQYAKTFQWAMTDLRLVDGLNYDASESTDHFYRDRLRTISTFDLPASEALTFDCFCDEVLPAGETQEAVDFFSSFGRQTTPLRWDRIMALQLLLAAFADGVGYANKPRPQDEFDSIASQITSPIVRRNLLAWLDENIGSVDKEGTKKITAALEGAGLAPPPSGSHSA
jgi:hypothetical protein